MSEYIIWNELGNVYLKIGSVDEAISAYLKAIELNPRYGWPYSNMAYAHVQKGNYTEAILLYKKSLNLLDTNKDRAISWNRLGDAYRHLLDYTRALDAYQTADQISGESTIPFDRVDATILFPEAILSDDGSAQATDGYAAQESSHRANPLDAAQPDLSNAFVQESQNLPDWLTKLPSENGCEIGFGKNVAQDDQVSENGEQSRNKERNISEWLRELLKVDARKETKSLDTGSRVARKTDLNKSSPMITEQYCHFPERSCDLPAPGTSSYPAMGNVSPAVLELDAPTKSSLFAVDPPCGSSMEEYPEMPVDIEPSWITRETTIAIPPAPQQTQLLDPVMAEMKKYEKIISLNETNDRAWDTLGKLYKSLGRYDDAIKAFERAIALTPHHEAYHYNLGLVFTVQNRYLDAIEYFQNAIALNNDYILAHGALAGCYRRLGKNEEAAQHIERAMPMMAGESEYNQACFNAICGNSEQAIELLRNALMKQDVSLEWVESDPDLESIRQDPRFQTLLQETQDVSVSV